MLKNQTNSQIVTAAIRGVDATNGRGSMSTDAYRVGFSRSIPYTGSLPKSWQHALREAFGAGRISQVIYSYSTPIAWFDQKYGWIIPAVTYSTTTSIKHQVHLYRTTGRRVYLPWDATAEDVQRVMDERMYFVTDSTGKRATGTRPGPNYVAGE